MAVSARYIVLLIDERQYPIWWGIVDYLRNASEIGTPLMLTDVLGDLGMNQDIDSMVVDTDTLFIASVQRLPDEIFNQESGCVGQIQDQNSADATIALFILERDADTTLLRSTLSTIGGQLFTTKNSIIYDLA